MTTNTNPKFEALLKAHQAILDANASACFGLTWRDRGKGAEDLPKRRAEMRELFKDMSTDELIEFKAYREARMR